MKISLKLLMLATALVATIVVWLQSEMQYRSLIRSTAANRVGETFTFQESTSATSGVMITDGLGNVVRASLIGDDSLGWIEDRGGSSHIRELYCDARGFELFHAKEYGALELLSLTDLNPDSQQLSQLSLSNLPNLITLVIETQADSVDMMRLFETIPNTTAIETLIVRGGNLYSIGPLPCNTIKRVILESAFDDTRILDKIRQDNPDCEIVVSGVNLPAGL